MGGRELDVKTAPLSFALMLGAAAILTASAPPVAQAQNPAQAQTAPQQQQSQQNQSSPLYQVTVTARTTKAINYRHLSGATKIDFRGTVLMPLAHGDAQVEGKRGAVRVQARFE